MRQFIITTAEGKLLIGKAMAAHHEIRRALDCGTILEKHPDGYVAYPLGLKGVVVEKWDTHYRTTEITNQFYCLQICQD